MSAENRRWGLGPIQTCKSGRIVAVFHAQNDREGLGSIEICYSGPEVEVLNAKTTGVVFDPQSLFIPVQKALFSIQKPHMRAGTHRDMQ